MTNPTGDAPKESAAQVRVGKDSLYLAVAAVLEADTEFRANMMPGWDGDPLSDEIDGLRRVFEAWPTPTEAPPVEQAPQPVADASGLQYRPNEFDDWGMIRNPDGSLFAVVRRPTSEEELAEHRRAKTDPYEDLARRLISTFSAPTEAPPVESQAVSAYRPQTRLEETWGPISDETWEEFESWRAGKEASIATEGSAE